MGKIAINGFGRIGRMAYRVLHERGLDKHVIAVNDLTDAPTLAHLLQYDSNYGKLKATVKSHLYENKPPYTGALIVDNHSFYVLSVKEPNELPWKALDVDVVIESTGKFTDPEGMKKHLAAGAKKVILSAPVEGEGVETIVMGVNDEKLTDSLTLVANASCTTNCISPVAQVIHSAFGVEKAMMTTIHSYTQDQMLQDGPHKDLRRARSAPQNIVPTTTGATKAATKAIPELEGIFGGLAIRVPTPVGSLSDFTFIVKKSTTIEEVNKVLKTASESGRLKGLLEYTEEPLVSSDIVGSTASSIVDATLTQVVGGTMVKVIAWYDNEWGYSNRLVDEVSRMANLSDTVKIETKPNPMTMPETKDTMPKLSTPIPTIVHNDAVGMTSSALPRPAVVAPKEDMSHPTNTMMNNDHPSSVSLPPTSPSPHPDMPIPPAPVTVNHVVASTDKPES